MAASDCLLVDHQPQLEDGTLLLAFTGWMDGGDVSSGTVRRLVELLDAQYVAEVDPEPFYIYNFPGPMEVAAMFRPHIDIEEGMVQSLEMPSNTFFCAPSANLLLFVGDEPNLRWQTFGHCVMEFARQSGVKKILFVGSFGGMVPHTREPRLYVSSSDHDFLDEMTTYGAKPSSYEGPGSFTSYLMTQAPDWNMKMASLAVEIPGYLEGPNLACLEAVARRLSHIFQLSLDLDSFRAASTKWELEVSQQIEDNDELAERVRELEEAYDNELLENSD